MSKPSYTVLLSTPLPAFTALPLRNELCSLSHENMRIEQISSKHGGRGCRRTQAEGGAPGVCQKVFLCQQDSKGGDGWLNAS